MRTIFKDLTILHDVFKLSKKKIMGKNIVKKKSEYNTAKSDPNTAVLFTG